MMKDTLNNFDTYIDILNLRFRELRNSLNFPIGNTPSKISLTIYFSCGTRMQILDNYHVFKLKRYKPGN